MAAALKWRGARIPDAVLQPYRTLKDLVTGIDLVSESCDEIDLAFRLTARRWSEIRAIPRGVDQAPRVMARS